MIPEAAARPGKPMSGGSGCIMTRNKIGRRNAKNLWPITPAYTIPPFGNVFPSRYRQVGMTASIHTAGTNLEQAFLPAKDITSLAITGPGGFPIGATRAQSNAWDNGLTAPHLTEDAFMVSVQLTDYTGDIYLDGKMLGFAGQKAGETVFYDYRRSWRANLRSPFCCVNFHVDRRSLGASLHDGSGREIHALTYQPGVPVHDDRLMELARTILPAFRHFDQANRLFMNHVGWALSSHLADRYGDAQAKGTIRGGLAPWQQQRALDMILANLTGNISIDDLAAECGVSAGHFARAFKKSLGTTPYRRLLQGRIEKAKDLLVQTAYPTADIAKACGFVDQSHLTRVFSRLCGETPAAWRKRQRTS
jgi:AraC family transcriptional regulator